MFVSNQGGVDLLPNPNPSVLGAAYSGWINPFSLVSVPPWCTPEMFSYPVDGAEKSC